MLKPLKTPTEKREAGVSGKMHFCAVVALRLCANHYLKAEVFCLFSSEPKAVYWKIHSMVHACSRSVGLLWTSISAFLTHCFLSSLFLTPFLSFLSLHLYLLGICTGQVLCYVLRQWKVRCSFSLRESQGNACDRSKVQSRCGNQRLLLWNDFNMKTLAIIRRFPTPINSSHQKTECSRKLNFLAY